MSEGTPAPGGKDNNMHSGRRHVGHGVQFDVDALLEEARTEQDVGRRLQMYQNIERMVVDDAPVLFLTHSLEHVLVKPHVQGYVLVPISIPFERYLWIDPDQFPAD